MIKVSELISKRLVCLSTAEIVGTISNIIFDSKLNNGKLLEIYNDDENDAQLKYVELKKIKSSDYDAVTVADDNYLTSAWNTETSGIVNPINCECFNQDGKSLGYVRDIVLDGAKVVSILVDKIEFEPKLLMSYSKELIILNDSGKPIKLPKTRASVPLSTDTLQVVKIHENTTNDNNIKKDNEINDTISVPSKVSKENTVVTRTPNEDYDNKNQYSFLIGKTVNKDIVNNGGDIIIAKGVFISDATITLAKESGKLVQLALRAE